MMTNIKNKKNARIMRKVNEISTKLFFEGISASAIKEKIDSQNVVVEGVKLLPWGAEFFENENARAGLANENMLDCLSISFRKCNNDVDSRCTKYYKKYTATLAKLVEATDVLLQTVGLPTSYKHVDDLKVSDELKSYIKDAMSLDDASNLKNFIKNNKEYFGFDTIQCYDGNIESSLRNFLRTKF